MIYRKRIYLMVWKSRKFKYHGNLGQKFRECSTMDDIFLFFIDILDKVHVFRFWLMFFHILSVMKEQHVTRSTNGSYDKTFFSSYNETRVVSNKCFKYFESYQFSTASVCLCISRFSWT